MMTFTATPETSIKTKSWISRFCFTDSFSARRTIAYKCSVRWGRHIFTIFCMDFVKAVNINRIVKIIELHYNHLPSRRL
nr:MAG TPA: hypothetical protein [Caudoviricetes sp.]